MASSDSREANIATFKAGWKGGQWFKTDFVKTPVRPFVDGISATNREMRHEKDYKRVPTVLGRGSQ